MRGRIDDDRVYISPSGDVMWEHFTSLVRCSLVEVATCETIQRIWEIG